MKKHETAQKKYTSARSSIFRLCLPLFIILLSVIFASTSFASQGSVLRVGWFYQPVYMDKDGGSYYGYNYDYLRRITNYTGWRYEFVEGSFSGLYAALKRGEIDILGSVFRTEERAAEVAFPNLDAGSDYLSMFTTVKSPLAENDFTAFNGIRVGFGSAHNRARLLEFAAKNGITVYSVEYSTLDEVHQALINGDVDAGLVGGFRNDGQFRALCRFFP